MCSVGVVPQKELHTHDKYIHNLSTERGIAIEEKTFCLNNDGWKQSEEIR